MNHKFRMSICGFYAIGILDINTHLRFKSKKPDTSVSDFLL